MIDDKIGKSCPYCEKCGKKEEEREYFWVMRVILCSKCHKEYIAIRAYLEAFTSFYNIFLIFLKSWPDSGFKSLPGQKIVEEKK